MIELKVIEVSRRESSYIKTIRFPTNIHENNLYSDGGTWEEIKFEIVEQYPATIQVGSIIGHAFIKGGENSFTIRINDPKLFGTYKIGDKVPLTVMK